jgi:hypothetical protein
MKLGAWLYLWPAVAAFLVFVLGMIAVLVGMNLLLGLGVMSLYAITPKDVLFDSVAQTFRNPTVESNIRETFSLDVKYPLPPSALYVWSPHALMSISSVMYNVGVCRHPAYMPNHLVSIPLFHYLPVISDIARYFGIIPSDYQSIEKTLAKKESVSVLLGGVREMTMVEDFKIRLCIKKRRGIFRLALTTGTPIIPVLTFGENELFSQAHSELLDTINKYLFETFGMHIPLPTVRSLFNWVELSYRPLKPIRSYTGKPIAVKQVASPTEKDIAELRDTYIKGVRDLFRETASSEYSLHIE